MQRLSLWSRIALPLLVSGGLAAPNEAAMRVALASQTLQLAQAPQDDAAACRQAPTKRCVIAMATQAASERRGNGDHPNIDLLDVARAQATAGDITGALALTDDIGANYNYVNYHDFLVWLAGVPGAVEQRQAILAAAARIPSDFHRTLTLEQIAKTFITGGHLEAARDAFRSATALANATETLFERATGLAEIAKKAAAAGEFPAAREAVYLALETAKMPVTPSVRSQVRASVAETLASMGDIEAALRIEATISDQADRVTTLARIAEAQAAAGNRTEAEESIHTALAAAAARDRPLLLARIASAEIKADDRANAADMIEVLLAMAQRMADPQQRAFALYQVAALQADRGDFEAALATAASIEDRTSVTHEEKQATTSNGTLSLWNSVTMKIGQRELALQRIADAQLRAGAVQAALATVAMNSEPYWRAGALSDLAKARLEADDIEAARATARAAVAAFGEVDIALKGSLTFPLREVFGTLVAVGDIDTAVATAMTIADARRRSDALGEIAAAWGKTADLAAVERMKTPFVRAVAFVGVAMQRADGGDVAVSREAIAGALAASAEVDDPELRPRVLQAIGEAQATIGDVEGARATMTAILHATVPIGGMSYRFAAARWVAKAQAESGDYLGALVTAQQIVESSARMQALLDIAAALPK
jgi:tetratricopeptide (TPR) repeat protein